MGEKEFILSEKSVRLFDLLVLHNTCLKNDKKLQEDILKCLEKVVEIEIINERECRQDIIDAIIKVNKTEEAKKRALKRDEKYAPFRNEFKQLQKEKYQEYLTQNKKLSANGFVEWFLKEKAINYNIPYVSQNIKIKLIQLAQKNNQEFKKSL